MFFHNFKYTLKTLFRNHGLLFWTFAFPLIMAILFNMAFFNIENSEKLDLIDIAIVNNEEFTNNLVLSNTFATLSSDKNENQLFKTQYVEEETAKNLLENDEISGYLIITDDTSKVVVQESGINQTVLKYITDEIMEQSKIMEDLTETEIANRVMNGEIIDYNQIMINIQEIIENSDIEINDISSSNLSYTMIEFYTLIAMTCLYGGIIGMTSINYSLPNMSSIGKRIASSPISKFKIVLSSTLASFIVQLIGVALLLIFTICFLHINYGDNLLLIILLSVLGSLAGLSLGVMTGTLLKTNENTKTGLIIAITMLCSFLSGMMGITMKYIIDKNLPILNLINPASMITDGFYSLYYYDTFNRYIFDLSSLLIFSIIMFSISFLSLRRQKYDSI